MEAKAESRRGKFAGYKSSWRALAHALRRGRDNWKQKYSAIKLRLRNLFRQLRRLRQRLEKWQAQAQAAQSEIRDLKAQVAELEAQVAQLKAAEKRGPRAGITYPAQRRWLP